MDNQKEEEIDFMNIIDELSYRVFHLKLENDLFSEALFIKMFEDEKIEVQVEDVEYEILKKNDELEVSISKYYLH